MKAHKTFWIIILFPVFSFAQDSPFALRIESPLVIQMKGTYGNVPDEATYTILPEERSGKTIIHALWETKAKRIEGWLTQGSGIPFEIKFEKRASGEKIRIIYKEARKAEFRHEKDGKEAVFEVEGGKTFYDSLFLDLLLMGFPFDSPQKIEFAVVDADSKEGDVYNGYVEIQGKEKIKVGEKEVECLDILFSLSGVVGILGPKYHFFYEAAPPHRYVSYYGPDERFTVTELKP